MDTIRDRFGNDSVMRAVFAPKPGQHRAESGPARPAVDHMSGGISREKKNYAGIPSVEYDCLITLLGKQFPAMLIHFLTEEKWVLKYK